jgi:hypothetical protein
VVWRPRPALIRVNPTGLAPAAVLADLPHLAKFVPEERRTSCAVLEIRPTGHFVTYGLGVPLLRMRDPAAARARIPIDGAAPSGPQAGPEAPTAQARPLGA